MTVYGYDVNLSIEHALALKNNIVAVKTLDEMVLADATTSPFTFPCSKARNILF